MKTRRNADEGVRYEEQHILLVGGYANEVTMKSN